MGRTKQVGEDGGGEKGQGKIVTVRIIFEAQVYQVFRMERKMQKIMAEYSYHCISKLERKGFHVYLFWQQL